MSGLNSISTLLIRNPDKLKPFRILVLGHSGVGKSGKRWEEIYNWLHFHFDRLGGIPSFNFMIIIAQFLIILMFMLER